MLHFLTRVLGLPPSCLYVTYFSGSEELDLPPDDETRDIWLSLGYIQFFNFSRLKICPMPCTLFNK